MKELSTNQLQLLAWGISLTVAVLAVVAWGQGVQWKLSGLSTYQLFPLFGLLAFSLMWSHYVAAALKRFFDADKAVLHQYFEITSAVVLVAILLHPGLLGWQLWRDGVGLPPGSYKLYVGPVLYSSVLLGVTAWILFLAYELRRIYGKRPWWRFVQYASDGAMLLIVIHALRLGGELQEGWFRIVWYFYALSLIAILFYFYAVPKKTDTPKK